MVGEEVDGTSIPLNPAKSWTIGGGGRMAIKGKGEQQERKSRKTKERTGERK